MNSVNLQAAAQLIASHVQSGGFFMRSGEAFDIIDHLLNEIADLTQANQQLEQALQPIGALTGRFVSPPPQPAWHTGPRPTEPDHSPLNETDPLGIY